MDVSISMALYQATNMFTEAYPFTHGRRLLDDTATVSDDDEAMEQRLEASVVRTVQFLWVFGLFALSWCSFSYYMYGRPYDGVGGSSLASKIRRIPGVKWFFRQPVSALQTMSPAEIEPLTAKEPEVEVVTSVEGNEDEEHDPGHGTTKAALTEDGTPNELELTSSDKKTGELTPTSNDGSPSGAPKKMLFGSENTTLAVCAFLLLCSYLTWGFMQERIMAHPYGDKDDDSNWFTSSEWCVMLNRLFGVVVSTVALSYAGPSGNDCPPFYYSLCALSNMMSSWFQYESLQYITFPVQTIFKSSKVLITMGVGRIMGKSFPRSKYCNALVIGVGVYVFLMGQRQGGKGGEDKDVGWFFYLGLALVSAYAFCDAFTSNWQSKVFATTKVSALEMMQGVNCFTFTVSLVFVIPSIQSILLFYATHPLIILHSLIMGLCAGFGQVLIFYTIQNFGAVKFATVMTTRMVLSVLISVVHYGHSVTSYGLVGMVVTFAALFYQAFDKKRGKKGGK